MLNDVSAGRGSAEGDATVKYVVLDIEMLVQDGVMGWTGSERAWYQSSTGELVSEADEHQREKRVPL